MKYRLILLVIFGSVIAVLCFAYFAWGMAFMQDSWDASRFVIWLLEGAAAALIATVAAEILKRSNKCTLKAFPKAVLVGVPRLLLLLYVITFLFCNVGAVRGVWYSVARGVMTYGMARDHLQ